MENLAIVDNNSKDTIEVDNNKQGLLYTTQEVEKGITINKEDVATNSRVESKKRFDLNKESDFDNAIDGDEDIDNENM
jgi:hypothetical protein